jgi:cardiolipin synthase
VADVAQAFAEAWAETGEPLPERETTALAPPPEGGVSLRVLAGTSFSTGAFRGVDVRLLVPGAGSDIALVQAFSRAGYRTLLEGGVCVFEWNGPMMHAKTAVADGHWARVGSTNRNVASWTRSSRARGGSAGRVAPSGGSAGPYSAAPPFGASAGALIACRAR